MDDKLDKAIGEAARLPTRPFDAAHYLDDEATVIAYLRLAFEDGDPVEIRDALNTVARAKGYAALARQAGISRQRLTRALSAQGNPTLETLTAVVRALGVKMSIAA